MRDPYTESRFPKLQNGGYAIKSKRAPKYNCIAFAVGNETRWWQWMPRRTKGYYWPIDWDNSLQSWIEVFRIHGYEPCKNADFESGIEKIAIYVDEDRVPTHVAKQHLPSRKWISKLGKGKDIAHDTLELLAGYDIDEYGKVEQIMMRPYGGEVANEANEETKNETTQTLQAV
jgi:hypothetical protein